MSVPLWLIVIQYLFVSLVVFLFIMAEIAIEAYDDEGDHERAYLMKIFIRWYRFILRRKNGS